VTDRVFIPIAGVGTIVLDAEAYQAALRPVSMPSSEIKAEAPLLVDAAKLGELTSTSASWWEAAARDSDCPSLFVGKYRRFSIADCLSWLAKVQERDGTGRARRCGAAPRAGT
jgi:hypothetical protein